MTNGGGDAIRFGCVLATDDESTREQLQRLSLGLSRALGTVIAAHPYATPDELARAFGQGQLDLVWASPTLALMTRPMRGGVPMVSSIRQGVTHYHSVLFVRNDSPIRSPLDLRGSHAAWVAKSSASGYIFARIALAGNGIDPDGLFGAEMFLDHHGAVAEAVLRNEADVGATFAAFEGGKPTEPLRHAGYLEVPNGDQARVLLPTPAIPADVLVASRPFHRAVGDRLVDALERAAESDDVAEPMRRVLGAEGFRRFDPDTLGELQRQIGDAEALGLI